MKGNGPAKANNYSYLAIALGIVAVVVVAVILFASQYNPGQQNQQSNQVACTMDAKMCPDGSYVGRTGPNCEFAACPEVSNCSCPKGYIADNGVCNPNCYYLTPKCLAPSIACTPAK